MAQEQKEPLQFTQQIESVSHYYRLVYVDILYFDLQSSTLIINWFILQVETGQSFALVDPQWAIKLKELDVHSKSTYSNSKVLEYTIRLMEDTEFTRWVCLNLMVSTSITFLRAEFAFPMRTRFQGIKAIEVYCE